MSIRRNAEETKEWDRFWGSGKVEDYLSYKSSYAGEQIKDKEAVDGKHNGRKFLDKRDRFT